MEQFSSVSNWKLTIRRETAGVTVLRARTCDTRAVLPETLFGLPITALGRHALSPTAAPETGEEVLLTCGPGQGAWDNSSLQELTLPATLRRVGDYAFFNCRALQTLHLHDGITFWGGGALMNCRMLSRLYLTWTGEQGETLSYFADELSRELDVTIDGDFGRARLIFPEYLELYEENCPAHHFDYNIQGAGYPYHHCFRWKRFRFLEYDALWEGYLAMDHEEDTALRLAWWRLRYPIELGERAEEAYRAYLQTHVGEALTWLLEMGDATGISFLLRWAEPTREVLSAACAQAREQAASEALAVLLEAQNKRFSKQKTFDL